MIPFLAPLLPFLQTLIQPVIAALPKIGAAIANFIAKIPPPVLEKVIAATIDIVGDLAKRLLGCSDSPAELGDKALNAEKKPEDFETTSDYIKYLENDIKLDREAFHNLTPEEKRTRELAGTEIYRQGISEKLSFNVSDDFLIFCGKVGLDAKTVYLFLDSVQQNGSITQNDICAYFEGKCQPEKAKEIGNFCRGIFLKTLDNPTLDTVNQKMISLMEEAGKVY